MPQPSASDRRNAVRTGVVWAAVRALLEDPDNAAAGEQGARIVDIGGGTGGFAVPLAGLGHDVLVVDPSPDALAALGRRAAESGVADRVRGIQGGVEELAGLLPDDEPVDLVLCHGVLEVVDDPAAALAAIAGVLRPGGTLSLLVAQRHAAVVARAMAGHFAAARELLDAGPRAGQPESVRGGGRRFTHEEIAALVEDAGMRPGTVHAVRVFTDLVPSALLDAEPGAGAALLALEQAVAERPEYLTLATQVHLLATR